MPLTERMPPLKLISSAVTVSPLAPAPKVLANVTALPPNVVTAPKVTASL